MPSKSKKQHNFMAAIANNPAFAKKAGVVQSVGEDFIKADKGKKFKEGGEMKEKKMAKGGEMKEKKMAKGGKAGPTMPAAMMAQVAKSGIPRRMRPTQDIEAPVAPDMPQPPQPMRKGGKVKKMAEGGSTAKKGRDLAHGEHSVQERGHTKAKEVKMAKGGFVKAADGIASRGKTRGKLC